MQSQKGPPVAFFQLMVCVSGRIVLTLEAKLKPKATIRIPKALVSIVLYYISAIFVVYKAT